MNGIIEWMDLGLIAYCDAWELQDRIRDGRVAGKSGDTLLLVEHPPVFTLGRRDCSADFLSSLDMIASEGIEVVQTNRGGRATYHGPGQLVGYFICDLDAMGIGIKGFVHAIEDICLRVLSDFHVFAERMEDRPGLWVGGDKIVAVGLNVSHNVTQHGFAINVDPDLAAYRHIVACGIKGCGVTSMGRLLPRPPSMESVKESAVSHVGRVLSSKMVRRPPAQPDVNVRASVSGRSSATGSSSNTSM